MFLRSPVTGCIHPGGVALVLDTVGRGSEVGGKNGNCKNGSEKICVVS